MKKIIQIIILFLMVLLTKDILAQTTSFPESTLINHQPTHMTAIGIGFHFGPYHQDNSSQGKVYERLGLMLRDEYHLDGVLWAPIDFLLWERTDNKKIVLNFLIGAGFKVRIRTSSFNLLGDVGLSGPGGSLYYFDMPYSLGIELPMSEKMNLAIHMRHGATWQLGLTRFILFMVYFRN